MQLPDKGPLMENMVVTSADELREIITKGLSEGSGAFLKIFAKDSSGKYYLTVLFDRAKILAAEGIVVDQRKSLTGDEAITLLQSLIGRPMVVDVYSLDELEIKLSVADNVDIYAQTPKLPLNELLGTSGETGPPLQSAMEKPPVKALPAEPSVSKTTTAQGTSHTTSEIMTPVAVEKPKPAAPEKPEVVISVTGGSIPERAFQVYAEDLLKEAKRVKGLSIRKIEFDANIREGVAYLNVRIYGNSTGSSRDIEVAEKRMLHAVSKYAPVLLREAEIKPIIKDVSVVIDGQEIKPQEIVDRDKKKTANVTKDGRITLSVLEDVWTYFSAYARTVVTEIENAGIKVNRAYFDIRGRKEFEINLSLVAETEVPKDTVERIVKDVVSRRAKELSRSIRRYISVHNIEVEVIVPRTGTVVEEGRPVVTSGKAAEVLAKKELLEKEVEELLKQAGIDELAPLTEEKKKEAKDTMLKGRIEPAMEDLRNRIHAELKLIPRVTFKWLKLNHEVEDSTVYVDIETSFLREQIGGLFGSFSGVSDAKIREEIEKTVRRIIMEVSKQYGLTMKLRRLKVLLH